MLLKPLTLIAIPVGIAAWSTAVPAGWSATAAARSLQGSTAEISLAQAEGSAADRTAVCPPSALSRIAHYRVQAGDTLDSIATQYNLVPPTLVRLNPNLQNELAVGQDILVPPFNGIVVTVARGQTWEQVASQYQSRADVLFEVNGCETVVPERVFVPGLGWLTGAATAANNTADMPLRGYPLPETTDTLVAYGWQTDPTAEKLVFNTGVTLASSSGTAVLAVGDGTVAFAGEDNIYGNLVVVNHQQGLQTRYANLGSVAVSVGQGVKQGATLGTVAPYADSPESFLFFEVRQNSDLGWIAQDPQTYIPALAIR